MIDPGRLRLLHDLLQHGTMSAVAAARRVSTSAVSQQFAQLEGECGTALLRRDGRRVMLTPAGERLARHAERLTALLKEAEVDLAAGREDVSGTVRLAAVPSAAKALLPHAVTALRGRHPALTIELMDTTGTSGMAALRAWRIDAVILDLIGGSGELDDPRLEIVPLYTDALGAFLPADHPLAARDEVTLADLADESWSLNDRGNIYHQAIMEACFQEGFTPRILSAYRSIDVTMALVAAGCSISVQPEMWGCGYAPQVVVRPLVPRIERHIVVIMQRGSRRQPALAAAVAALHEAAASVERRGAKVLSCET